MSLRPGSNHKEKKMEQNQELLIGRLLMELTKHIGKGKAVGMGELYEEIYGEQWTNRINDTRKLRRLITKARYGDKPQPICSTPARNAPGYYLASAGSELEEYIGKLKHAALKKLAMAAKLERVPLPELLGQMAMRLREGVTE